MIVSQPFNQGETTQNHTRSCSTQSISYANHGSRIAFAHRSSFSGVPRQQSPQQQTFPSNSRETSVRGTPTYVPPNSNYNSNSYNTPPPCVSSPPYCPSKTIPASLRTLSSPPPTPSSPPANRSAILIKDSRKNASTHLAAPPRRPSSKPEMTYKFIAPVPRRNAPPVETGYTNLYPATGATPLRSGCPDRRYNSGELTFTWKGIQTPFTSSMEVLDLAVLLPTKDTVASIFGLWDTQISIFRE
eukprot:Awhi_evm1s1209